MSVEPGRIILCKALSNENDTQQSYTSVLENAGYTCDFLSALCFEFVNLDKLQECLTNHNLYSGLILTSRRSVEAIHLISKRDLVSLKSWEISPVYCVGPATASLVKESLNLRNCVGSESGNAKELAEFIVQNSKNITLPLLYPCSEISRDTVDQVLENKGMKFKKLVVYQTLTSKTLNSDLDKVMELQPNFIVFFSPSVVERIIPLLCEKHKIKGTKMIAIGPITGEALNRTAYKADAISKKPEPLALLRAIDSCSITKNKSS